MAQLHENIKELKQDLFELFLMTIEQIKNSKKALENNNKSIAKVIIETEEKINKKELLIDEKCENILTLFNPVAKDLRRVLAIYKINHELERIGDIADSIADFVIDSEMKDGVDIKLLEETGLIEMFLVLIKMQKNVFASFKNNCPTSAIGVLEEDKKLNNINNSSIENLKNLINNDKIELEVSYRLLTIIKKLERAGDHLKNIAEEIVFSVNSEVIKHQNKRKISS